MTCCTAAVNHASKMHLCKLKKSLFLPAATHTAHHTEESLGFKAVMRHMRFERSGKFVKPPLKKVLKNKSSWGNRRLVRLNVNSDTRRGTLTLFINQLSRVVNICDCGAAVICRHLVVKGKMSIRDPIYVNQDLSLFFLRFFSVMYLYIKTKAYDKILSQEVLEC